VPGIARTRGAVRKVSASVLFGAKVRPEPAILHATRRHPVTHSALKALGIVARVRQHWGRKVCRQTSPRRGQVPGEPPLRDARLWRVGGSAQVGGDLGRGGSCFWRGLSPNLSSPGPGPRRASSPRRAPLARWRFSAGGRRPRARGLVFFGEVCRQTSSRRGQAPDGVGGSGRVGW
jgi:hypothetical protein